MSLVFRLDPNDGCTIKHCGGWSEMFPPLDSFTWVELFIFNSHLIPSVSPTRGLQYQ